MFVSFESKYKDKRVIDIDKEIPTWFRTCTCKGFLYYFESKIGKEKKGYWYLFDFHSHHRKRKRQNLGGNQQSERTESTSETKDLEFLYLTIVCPKCQRLFPAT